MQVAQPLKKILVGMSGGVDSAAAALVLMRDGYEVVGMTALFQDDASSREAASDAQAVCEALGIPHYSQDCKALFEKEVICPFVDEYAAGLTPSPCVRCNARAKIPALLEVAHELGCEKVATGHYARVELLASGERYVVKTATDAEKDQSYMLSQLDQKQLSRLILPLGFYTKAEVRALAQEHKLPVAHKSDSQDICFISGSYTEFLKERGVVEEPGNIVDTQGKVLGRHTGLSSYTIGQRKGIGVAAPDPYYVLEKNGKQNELIVGFKNETNIAELTVSNMNWQAFESLTSPLECAVKLRYRSQAAGCIVEPLEEGEGSSVRVRLQAPQSTTAPGQFAVFYQGEVVCGGGIISATMKA